MDISLRSTHPTRSKDLEETRRKDINPITNHSTGCRDHHDHLLRIMQVFFSSIFYHVVLQSMVYIGHHSFIGYLLPFGRYVTGKLKRGVLLLHNNAPVDRANITPTAIQYTGFTEVNHPAYSPGVAPSDYHLFPNVKNFLGGRNFETDNEAMLFVNHCLRFLILILFSRGTES